MQASFGVCDGRNQLLVLGDVMPYSPHCTNVSGDRVVSMIKVDEDGDGTGNRVYQTTRRHISKDIGVSV